MGQAASLQFDRLDTTELLQFGSIPVVAALIGYGTNVIAIKMTFLPLEYLGFGEKLFRKIGFSCGWQARKRCRLAGSCLHCPLVARS